MIELKSLMGDSSDNIPGVTGVGQKTATDLITKYHSIDYIYKHLDELDIKDSVRAKLAADKDNAFLSRMLGTISCDAPIDANIEAYKIGEGDKTSLSQLMTKLEFFKLMEKMNITPSTVTVAQKQDVCDTCFKIGTGADIKDSVDIYIDGNSFSAVSGKIVCNLNEAELVAILENEYITKRVYDYKNLCKKYCNIKAVKFDAMLAAYLCNPSASDYSLPRLIAEYGTNIQIENCDDELLLSAAQFATCCNGLTKLLEQSGQLQLLYDIEVPLARVLSNMETVGFLADFDGLNQHSALLQQRIE